MHLILTGATGTIGNSVLKQCLASPKGDDLDTTKADVIIHTNYTDYPPALLSKLKGSDGCIWAQGISQTQVPKSEYVRITYDYPLAAAKAFASLSTTGKFNFVYVSSEGADPTEKTFALFGKIKGRAEKALLSLPSQQAYSPLRVFNARPGAVFPPEHHRPRSLGFKFLGIVLMPVIKVLAPSLTVSTGALALVLVDLASGNGEPLSGDDIEAEGRTLRHTAIRRLAGLKS
ncbi:hypothetical protein AN958_05743 [Leucoagaricus sp. SymC.cos]|nr:hypothetical protein AN958_05743 [Leucoagaricus sp. SymC.cos]